MITAKISDGHVVAQEMAYPLEITNLGIAKAIVMLSGINTIFSQNSIHIMPNETVVVYAATHATSDIITVSDGTGSVEIEVMPQTNNEIEFGTESYISIFQLPGEENNVIPTLENIDLLMRHGRYFKSPGELKIWRVDIAE